MRITPKNFVDHYVICPLSKDLSFGEKVLALAASILIALPTLGIIHARSFYLRSKKVVNLQQIHSERSEKLRNLSESISKVSFKVLQPEQEGMPFSQKDVPLIIQERFIRPCYAKPLPKREEVTVPYADPESGVVTWRQWSSLTRSEKIHVNNTGTHAHNKLASWVPEAAVDKWFYAHGQAPFLEGDPRESHGNDHAARAAIFSAVFGYLYQKYHPDLDLSLDDIALAQVVAAGHDCQRQTEGPDVYDEASAKYTCQQLSDLGIKSPNILKDAREAIEHKDSEPTKSKSVIAKCVQNADCAEFARLLLTSGSRQDAHGFENSRNYLDIFKELQAISLEQNPNDPKKAVLKNGHTFEGFSYELDALRQEMNALIYQTHKREFREKLASSDQDAFSGILQVVNPVEFPLLSSVLRQIGVKEAPPSLQALQAKKDIDEVRGWIDYGLERIDTQQLEKMKDVCNASMSIQVKAELEKRSTSIAKYQNAKNINELVVAYGQLQPLMKKQVHGDFLKRVEAFAPDSSVSAAVEKVVKECKETMRPVAIAALIEVRHDQLKDTLVQFESRSRKMSSISETEVDDLKQQGLELLDLYKEAQENLRSPEIQTTAALVFELSAHIYLRIGKIEKANEALKVSAEEIVIEKSNQFFSLEELVKKKQSTSFMYMPSDTGFIRKRKVGLTAKKIDGKNYNELAFEMTASGRERFQQTIDALLSAEQKKVVPAKYYPKKQGEFVDQDTMHFGTDLKITIAPGVELYVGDNKKYWNQYHFVRIRVEEGISTQEVHKGLASIGLPMALLTSRPEDVRTEVLARSLAFRFPQLTYGGLEGQRAPEELYSELSEAQRRVVDNDISSARLANVGGTHFEMVQPTIAQEAWDSGVRGLGSFIWGGQTMEETSRVMINILENGLFSSQERFQNGILSLGCVPRVNNRCGSANQVFTRVLTRNLFENQFDLSEFPVSGKVFIMLDPQVLERMPYSYAEDRGGVRNPNYYKKVFLAQKQDNIYGFKGKQRILERQGFSQHVAGLEKKAFPLNETMFDLTIGAKYIQKLVVWTDVDRLTLIACLEKAGIYHVNGVPLERVVVTAKSLSPALVDNYDQENPYRKDGIDGVNNNR